MKTNYIELGEGKTAEQITILYEDRSVIAIDKPPSWMLVPFSWQKTNRNLQAAITSAIAGKSFWARSRNLKFLQHIHRLDAETSGILLLAKSQGALKSYGELFESRRMEKVYLAVVQGIPKKTEWSADYKLAPNPRETGKMEVSDLGKDAETHFKILQTNEKISLIEARPVTGRTHQIRVHLLQSGFPIVGDSLYGTEGVTKGQASMGLRSIFLSYMDPFDRRKVSIKAPTETFLKEFGFGP